MRSSSQVSAFFRDPDSLDSAGKVVDRRPEDKVEQYVPCHQPRKKEACKCRVTQQLTNFEVFNHLGGLLYRVETCFLGQGYGITYREEDVAEVHQHHDEASNSCKVVRVTAANEEKGDNMVCKHLVVVLPFCFRV